MTSQFSSPAQKVLSGAEESLDLLIKHGDALIAIRMDGNFSNEISHIRPQAGGPSLVPIQINQGI